MAGRGVDIRLGGSDQTDRDRVAELGGLYVIGSGRHDSRRVDDQLRGRAGRQGDPGGSVFFVSLEDDLVVRHAGDVDAGVAADERRRPGHRRAGRLRGRARPAGRRGRQPRDPPQHLALQRGDRAAAQGPGRAPGAAAHLRRRRDHAAGAVAGEGRGDRRGRARPRRPGRSRSTTWTGSGPSTWPSCPRCARACTCGRWAGSTRSTSSTGRRCRRSTSCSPEIETRTIATFEETELDEDWEPDDAELVRPSATWTYLVHDNPFGSELDRLIASVGRRLGGGTPLTRLRGPCRTSDVRQGPRLTPFRSRFARVVGRVGRVGERADDGTGDDADGMRAQVRTRAVAR